MKILEKISIQKGSVGIFTCNKCTTKVDLLEADLSETKLPAGWNPNRFKPDLYFTCPSCNENNVVKPRQSLSGDCAVNE